MNFKNIIKNNYLKIFLLSIYLLLFFKIFFLHKHYPINDEIITFDRYLTWHSFLNKSNANNHLLLSLTGTIIKTIVPFNFLFLRFINFLFLLGIFFVFLKIYKKTYTCLFFIILIISSDIILNYSYLFRGYYLSSFISVLIFYYLQNNFLLNKENNLQKVLFLCSLLFVHSLYTLYIVLPILFSIGIFFIENKKFKFFLTNIIKYFFIPIIFISYLNILVSGFTIEFSQNLNINYFFQNALIVLKKSFLSGFKSVFTEVFSEYEVKNQYVNTILEPIFNLFSDQPTLFFIYFISFIVCLNKLFQKKREVLDLIIFLFFIFYLIAKKAPPERTYIGFVYFFIFYILKNIELFTNSNFNFIKYENIINFILFTALIYLLITLKINTSYTWQLKKDIQKINTNWINCEIANKHLDQYQVWILINIYQKKCFYYYDVENKINILSDDKKNANYKQRHIFSW